MRASNYVPYKKSGSHPDPDFYDYVYGDDDNDGGDGGYDVDGSDGSDRHEICQIFYTSQFSNI